MSRLLPPALGALATLPRQTRRPLTASTRARGFPTAADYARQDRERGGRDRRDDRSVHLPVCAAARRHSSLTAASFPPPRSSPPRRRRRHSPSYDGSGGRAADALLDEIDSEARSVCVSQLAAKLTSEDLGMFFEDKLGEGAVRDAKVVTDRISRRSKGCVALIWLWLMRCRLMRKGASTDVALAPSCSIGYVELDALELVERALKLTGEVVMGLPILVELTEAQRNKQARNVMPGFGPMDGRPPLTGCVSSAFARPRRVPADPSSVSATPAPAPCLCFRRTPGFLLAPLRRARLRLRSTATASPGPRSPTTGSTSARCTLTSAPRTSSRCLRRSARSSLSTCTATPSRARARASASSSASPLLRSRSRGWASADTFSTTFRARRYFDVEAAKTALQTMNGFELAGRQLRVSTVNEKQTGGGPPRPAQPFLAGVPLPLPGNAFQQQPGTGANASVAAAEGNKPESLDEHHGSSLPLPTTRSRPPAVTDTRSSRFLPRRPAHGPRHATVADDEACAAGHPGRACAGGPLSLRPAVRASFPLHRHDLSRGADAAALLKPPARSRPNIPVNPSLYVLVSNVFDPAECVPLPSGPSPWR